MDISASEGGRVGQLEGYDSHDIVRALELIYNPRSANDDRRLATAYLEKAKSRPEAPSFGFALAQDNTQNPIARHYGLSCLEHHVKYQWDSLDEEQTSAIRGWAIALAHTISDKDALFLRNKIAYLWTAIAERSWGISWLDFDHNLCELWKGSLAQREMVLHILETLSDEVFSKEDSTAGLRGAELGKLCVEIFTASAIMDEVFGQRKSSSEVRGGQEGWFMRLLGALRHYLQQDPTTEQSVSASIVKILSVLRSVMPWIIFRSVSDSDCLELLCRCLVSPGSLVQMGSIEVMHAMFHRPNNQDDQIEKSAFLLMTSDGVSLLHRFYESCCVNVDDIDETRYTTLKKFSEVICALGMYLIHQKALVQDSMCDLNSLFELFIVILQNPSLVVSVPVLYLWTKLLSEEYIYSNSNLSSSIGTLLEVCSSRLIRYEMLPPDSTDSSFLFLNEDFETIPDRHAFLGNFRRFCTTVIQHIVSKEPYEAMSYLLSQSDNMVQNVQKGEQNFSERQFASDSFGALRIDAQCTVISTALKSYIRSLGSRQHMEEDWKKMQQKLEQWCMGILQCDFQDPIIRKRLLVFIVDASGAALPSTSNMGLEVCKSVLASSMRTDLGSSPYDEALKDLQSTRPRELQKLAMTFSDSLMSVYDDLEAAVKIIVETPGIDSRIGLDYRAFLFTIVLRANVIDEESRCARFQNMIQPVFESWRSPAVDRATTDFSSFCNALGLEDFPSLFLSYKAHEIEDWSSQPFDERGSRLREKTRDAVDRLPLLATRSLLSISTDRLPQQSRISQFASLQWQEIMPTLLPKLLRLIGHAHAFNNPDRWLNYPPELRPIITHTVQDRVWQNGISSESRDDFYAKIRDSKTTLEGLASAIRGSVRNVRELCMFILHYVSNFGEFLYCHYDIPEPLSQALYADANHLSAHQLNSLLRLSSALIEGCPAAQRHHFLPPMLTALFKQLDAKTSAEWDAIERRSNYNATTHQLDSEMKTESVLRNLTHFAVLMVSNFLGLQTKSIIMNKAREFQSALLTCFTGSTESQQQEQPSIRTIILTSSSILEPVILFCTHALRMHDSRCCVIITRVLRSLIPEFQARPRHNEASNTHNQQSRETNVDATTAVQVREFFSTEVLKSCITSLNEPYFSEASLQKDLASLIASILVLYSPVTSTPRQILLSLPGMSERKVDGHIDQILRTESDRQQRAWVLSLLESVRGVSIHELGKVDRSARKRAPAIQEQFMTVDETHGSLASGATSNAQDRRQTSPDLGGVSDLFS